MSSTVEDKLFEEKLDFFHYLKENGFTGSAAEAANLAEYKITHKEEVDAFKKLVQIGKTIPLEYLEGFFRLKDKEKKDLLWELGLNTRGFKWVLDVQCYVSGEKRMCGYVVYGQERTDKEWLTIVINGRNVASDEARFYKDRDTLQVMRGNKKELG